MIRIALFLILMVTASSAANAVECALLDKTDAILERKVFSGSNCPPDLPSKGWRWLPIVVAPLPDYDPATEVLLPPVTTVGTTQITVTQAKRSKTAQEIDDEKTAKITGMDIAVFKALCHLKNEIRTKVQGLSAWTDAQCLAAFKGLLP